MTEGIALATVLAAAMLLDLGQAAVKAAGDWGWGDGTGAVHSVRRVGYGVRARRPASL